MKKVLARGYRSWNLKYVPLRVKAYNTATKRKLSYVGISKVMIIDGKMICYGQKRNIFTIPDDYEIDIYT